MLTVAKAILVAAFQSLFAAIMSYRRDRQRDQGLISAAEENIRDEATIADLEAGREIARKADLARSGVEPAVAILRRRGRLRATTTTTEGQRDGGSDVP